MLKWFGILLIALGLQAQDVHIQVLGTTDMHGHVMAEDTFSLQPANQGWAKVATLIRQLKAANPNTVLVDCGDTIQGEPINYIHNVLRPDLPEPSIAIMNALGYAAMAVGNHEYNFGLGVLRSAQKEATFPFLSANTVEAASGKPAFPTSTVVTVAGVRILLVGFTTPRIPHWEEPENYAGLRFLDIVDTARTLVPRLKAETRADVVIALVHSGLGAVDGHPGDENEALRLADQVPGLDAIFTGHTHEAIETTYKGIPILQASCFGRALAVVDLDMARVDGRWQVSGAKGHLVRPDDSTAVDPEVLTLTQALRAATTRYLDTPATNLLTDLDGRWGRMEDTPLAELLHTVQLKATGAQLSAVACADPHIFIPKGATSVRQFYALEPYENRVAMIRITGAQLKLYLEHAARAYHFSWQPDLFNPKVPFFDIDTVAGVDYALDLGKPVGHRVVGLAYQGKPVRPEDSFTLALSTYRLRGGGGYMEAIGFKGKPELVTDDLQRNLLLEYVLSHPSLSVAVVNNWRTIPYLDRERLLPPAK
ncbi:MAG: bifunctional metallophosphatase/5'-nucleotidase [Acidobacteriota bacterium]|nr:bifunctional metallophosphatase/5'-nucleotidase [Acidobacteriota bacterium]